MWRRVRTAFDALLSFLNGNHVEESTSKHTPPSPLYEDVTEYYVPSQRSDEYSIGGAIQPHHNTQNILVLDNSLSTLPSPDIQPPMSAHVTETVVTEEHYKHIVRSPTGARVISTGRLSTPPVPSTVPKLNTRTFTNEHSNKRANKHFMSETFSSAQKNVNAPNIPPEESVRHTTFTPMTNKVHPTVGSAPTGNDDIAFRSPIKRAPQTTDSYQEDVDMEVPRRRHISTYDNFSNGAAHECQEYWVMWLILLIIGFLLGFFLGALIESTALHMFDSNCSASACDCTRSARVATAGVGIIDGETATDSSEDSTSTSSSTSLRGKPTIVCPYDAELLRSAGEKVVHPHSLRIQVTNEQSCADLCSLMGTCIRSTYVPNENKACYVEVADLHQCGQITGRQARNCAGASCVQWQKRCLCLDSSTPLTTTGLTDSLLLSHITEAVKCGPLGGERNSDNITATTLRAILAPFTTTATPQSNNLLLAAQRINLTPRLYVKMICDASARA